LKILTLIGTRPEIIRLSVIVEKLNKLVDHVLVYTNQNFDYNLSKIFFNELRIRKPDYYFEHESKSFGDFLGNAIIEFEKILIKEKPDKILILGDTNSALLAIVAAKHKIPVYHMEAGNRAFDNRVPEEMNRRIIDNVSTYNLPYIENSKQNLLDIGFSKNNVFKTGNPIFEVLENYSFDISNSDILKKLNLYSNEYVLVTAHRSENVDNEETLRNIINAINIIDKDSKEKIVFSIHPRTRNKLKLFNIKLNEDIIVSEPFGFFDFVKLERNAKCIISDSGTTPEEGCIFGIPSLVIREYTERQELIECGSSILCGTKTENIIEAYNIINKRKNKWIVPDGYLIENVSDIIINVLLGKI